AGERLQRTLQTRLPKLTVIRTTSPLDHHSTWLEIFPGNVSKSKSACWLCGELNLDTRQTVTIGNDYNDIDLLEWGACSYVVGNAPGDLRDQFTPVSSHDDNGFTQAVNRWLVRSSDSLPR
ncbi:MAG TPA: HAD family phosphatase, partial [Gammaproteobacteria bacterium]|nr:HAD family phosphatase [Gammaproteobacteria bacterium]